MKPIVIKNGRVVDPSGKIDGIYDISIAGGKITSLSNSGESEGEGSGSDVIDATGMVVIPGLIDIHVHLREPGYEYKETIASGAMAAVAGVSITNGFDPCGSRFASNQGFLMVRTEEGFWF